MKKMILFFLIVTLFLLPTACARPAPEQITATQSVQTQEPVADNDTQTLTIPTNPTDPQPTELTTENWSTSASTRTELSFAFPGNWDGSSPLPFGEGEFVKDPNLPIGVTFQINLQGNPQDLLAQWGSANVGITGITTFVPESITDGPDVIIARVNCQTKIATGEGITGAVAYIDRGKDVLEVMWFSPSDQWQDLQPTFEGVLAKVELWQTYADLALGLQTMYVHDWEEPTQAWENNSLWFKSSDEKTGLILFIVNEIADPVEKLTLWQTDRLIGLELALCSIEPGDRMDTMSGKWESRMGECENALGENISYEVAFIPDKDRLIEMITYSPAEFWEKENQSSFKNLLGLMIDLRP